MTAIRDEASVRPRRPRREARPETGSPSSTAPAREDRTLWVALDWIERHDVVPDGFRKGQPFALYGYQGQYLANFYLVRGDVEWHPSAPILAPAYVYRRGLLIGPQKVGKNPLIAAQVTLEGVGPALFAGWAGPDDGYVCRDHGCPCGWEYPYVPGDPMGMPWPSPLIQITAFSEDSTENTYDALRPMIEDGPLADVIPKTGEEFIRLPGGGRIDTVTSSNQSRLGARSTFVPQDELGLWTAQNKMVKLADTQYRNLSGMGGRASLTSNAWDPAEFSVAQLQFESSARDTYRQFVQPPKNLSYADKRERRKIHLIVYPADVLRENGGHVNLDGIEA
ncbi:MAG: terminase, partial [Candidatus Limnocylindrales bacterium]